MFNPVSIRSQIGRARINSFDTDAIPTCLAKLSYPSADDPLGTIPAIYRESVTEGRRRSPRQARIFPHLFAVFPSKLDRHPFVDIDENDRARGDRGDLFSARSEPLKPAKNVCGSTLAF